ncbi:MAG: GNAT family N-acetyltransferase [Methanomicrobia archaeon]|nr:GNAT family N-acetyltransferase [Methanomicrobia archaeon]
MEFKKLEFSDYDSLINVWKRSGLPIKKFGRDSRENIQKQMKDDHLLFLGAFEGNKLIGVVLVNHEGRKGWINRLAVLPEFQRRRVASKLIEYGETWLREKGIKIYATLIEDYNNTSKTLFKKLGYISHSDIFYFSKRESDET